MTIARSQALPERQEWRAQSLPAAVTQAGLRGVLRSLDRLQPPERPWQRRRDGGEVVRSHAAPDGHARDGQRRIPGPPPADTAGAEGPIAELVEDGSAVRRLPATWQRGAALGSAQAVLEDALRLSELVADGARVEVVQERVRERMAADLHPRRRHLAQLRPRDVSRRLDQRRDDEERGAHAELGERREGIRVVAGGAVVESEAEEVAAELGGNLSGHHRPQARVTRGDQMRAQFLGRQGVRPMRHLDVGESVVRHDVVQAEHRGAGPHTYPSPSSMSWMRFSSSAEYENALSGST